VNVTTVLQVAHWLGLLVSGTSFILSACNFAWQWQQQFVHASLLISEKLATTPCALVMLLGRCGPCRLLWEGHCVLHLSRHRHRQIRNMKSCWQPLCQRNLFEKNSPKAMELDGFWWSGRMAELYAPYLLLTSFFLVSYRDKVMVA